jgi:hypothetical protein
MSKPYILNPEGSQIPDEWLETNAEFQVIPYRGGQAPQVIIPPTVAQETVMYLRDLIDRAYQLSGISQFSSSGEKPVGREAGVAIRSYQEIETRRFSQQYHRLERFVCALGRQVVQSGREVAEKYTDWRVNYHGDKFIESISWKDVEMPDDAFVIQVEPASHLPETPSARKQDIIDLVNGGVIRPKDGRQALRLTSDLDKLESLETAELDLTYQTLEKMLEDGEYRAPCPYQDLDQVRKVAVQYYLKARLNGVDEDKLTLLERHASDAIKLQEDLKPPQPPQPQPPPAGLPQMPPGPGGPVGP